MKASFFGLASTGFSGITNIIVQLIAAILLPTEDFARFSLGATTVILIIGLSRMLVGQVDVIRGAREGDCKPISASYLMSIIVAVLGVILLAASLAARSQILSIIAVSIFISSAFIIQDNLRFRAFRQGRAGVALASDLVMFAGAVLGLLVILFIDAKEDYIVLTVWAISAVMGAGIGIHILKYYNITVLDGKAWFKENRDIIIPSAGEYLLIAGLPYMVNFLILFVGGAEALAGYRLIQLILAAVGNIAVGINSTAVPRLVNYNTTGAARKMRQKTSIGLSAIIIIITVCILVLPENFGLGLFGENWINMQPFIWVGAFHAWVNALGVTNMAVLRVLGLAVTSFWIRLVTVFIGLTLTLLAADHTGDPVLIAWGIAVPTIVAYCGRTVLISLKLRKLDHLNAGALLTDK